MAALTRLQLRQPHDASNATPTPIARIADSRQHHHHVFHFAGGYPQLWHAH
jgi:hypothetical protein